MQKFFDNDGRPLAGGLLFTYEAGTTVKVATYTDSSGSTPNTNPIVLDFRGECEVWIDPSISYKFTLAPATDTDPPSNPIWTVDNITAAPAVMDNVSLDTGSGNSVQLTIDNLPSTPSIFTRVVWKSALENTGPVTITLNGGLAKSLTWQNSESLSPSSILVGGMYEAIYNGLVWHLQGPTLMPGNVITAEELIAGIAVEDYSIPSYKETGYVNPFRYFTKAQQDSVRAYNYTQSVQGPLQNAMNLAWNVQCPLYLPGGGYLVTTLTMPGASAFRYRQFIMRGAGVGEIFSRTLAGGTIFKSTTNAPILQYIQDVASTGNGSADISLIRFEGDSDSPNYVVNFEAFYAQSYFHDCAIFQAGTGGGMNIGLSNTVLIERCYFINGDWNNTTLGAARTGIGLNIVEDIDTGLTTVRKCTMRGFKDGAVVGDGTHRNFSNRFMDCEFSVVFNGITLSATTEKFTLDGCYFEGGDQGTGVTDNGNYNLVQGNYIFPGYGTCIDASTTSKYGGVYRDNVLSAGSVAGSKLMKLGGTNKSKAFTDNTLVFGGSGGSVTGVVALTLTGSRPTFDLSGNSYDPAVNWVGGAGTARISDATTNGATGYLTVSDSSLEFPAVRNGVRTNGRGSTLADSAVAANVLTLPKLNTHTVTMTGAQSINSITITGGSDDEIEVTIISTNANITFNDTASINMVGGAAYTPGASGGVIRFAIRGAIAFELSRGSY